MIDRRKFLGLLTASASAPAVRNVPKTRTIALLSDSLVSPLWIAAIELLRRAARDRGWFVLGAVSNMDNNCEISLKSDLIPSLTC